MGGRISQIPDNEAMFGWSSILQPEDDETEEDLDFNSLEISMLKERMYDLEERVSDLEDTDDEEEEESDDDDSVI